MTPQVIACYGIGGALALCGLLCACFEGFTSTEWWLIGSGVVLALVGLFVQLGWLNPPEKE